MTDALELQLKTLPESPGIYQYYDIEASILYRNIDKYQVILVRFLGEVLKHLSYSKIRYFE